MRWSCGLMVWSCVLVGGCGATAGGLPRPAHEAHVVGPHEALDELVREGPERFAMVTPRLYRGGQPDEHELELLRALGITTVIDLRRERLGVRRAEWAVARRLGMRFVELPYYGVFGADGQFIRSVLEEMEPVGGGAVYIHCGDGGDRTSLMVALYRVLRQGWDPSDAWDREVLEYGHHRSPAFREIELTYREVVHEHELAVRTAQRAETNQRAIAMAHGRSTTTEPRRTDRGEPLHDDPALEQVLIFSHPMD